MTQVHFSLDILQIVDQALMLLLQLVLGLMVLRHQTKKIIGVLQEHLKLQIQLQVDFKCLVLDLTPLMPNLWEEL